MFEDIAYQAIPFFFTMAIAYGGLQISELFKNKAANMLIALAVALFAASNAFLADFIYSILGPATMLFIIFFFVGFAYKLFNKKKEKDYTLMVIILGLVMLLLTAGAGGSSAVPVSGLFSEDMVVILALVFIAAMFYATYKQDNKQK